MSDSSLLVVKIPQEIADIALLILQVSHTGFDGWTMMYVTVNSPVLQDGTPRKCLQCCYDAGLENGDMLLAG